jgi:uncharacterized repeat protein (TIGR03803 family)
MRTLQEEHVTRIKTRILPAASLAVVFVFLAITAPVFAASNEKVLHNFKDNGKDGYSPEAGLVFDKAGNLYGTTYGAPYGGTTYGSNGTVFELSPGADGKWTEKVLHEFCAIKGCPDGKSPNAALILDAAGNLYGTTQSGGAYGFGTVFQLTPGAGGKWTEKVLHSFGNGTDGYSLNAGLIFDASGNLYGTTYVGGTNSNGGTVFELSPGAGGAWTETVLYNFCARSGCVDGDHPSAALIFDSTGNLFGTTFDGGARGYGGFGTVFELSPGAGGTWTEKVLHSFYDNGSDGNYPWDSLVLDAAGHLYATTARGGADHASNCFFNAGCGTVFELTPEANGKWKEKILHSFRHNGKDGYGTAANLAFDAAGNLYGTTEDGGSYDDGTIFELKRGASGDWRDTVVYSFGQLGIQPASGVIVGVGGKLYGTTLYGGDSGTGCGGYGCGTVFEITP